jgi:hypothetical protein
MANFFKSGSAKL